MIDWTQPQIIAAVVVGSCTLCAGLGAAIIGLKHRKADKHDKSSSKSIDQRSIGSAGVKQNAAMGDVKIREERRPETEK